MVIEISCKNNKHIKVWIRILISIFTEKNVYINYQNEYIKWILINPLNTKRRLLYLKTQFVPRSKHVSSLL